MRTLEAITISKAILNNLDTKMEDSIQEFIKNGFVNIDGSINQYVPGEYDFSPVSKEDLKNYINILIPNKWNTLSYTRIINELTSNLPSVTQMEVNNFKAYIEQYQLEINNDLIKTRLNEVLNESKALKDIEVTIKDGRDISNQLIVMKQNNIFADMRTRKLFKYKDGNFEVFGLNDVMGLLNSYLSNEDNPIKVSDVQRNRKVYLTSLEDINDIRTEISKKRNRNEILEIYTDDYKKILKLIRNY